jgi:hypothetical protein
MKYTCFFCVCVSVVDSPRRVVVRGGCGVLFCRCLLACGGDEPEGEDVVLLLVLLTEHSRQTTTLRR